MASDQPPAVTGEDGREALEILLNEVPAVMLVQLMMQIMYGAELRRH
jgi:CheY-like chemotaxis protein